MAAGFTPVNKRLLENTSMCVYHIRDGAQSTSISFKIKIDKFSKMKCNEIYNKPLSYKDWILYVLKERRKTVTLTLRTFSVCPYSVKCQVKYCNDSGSHIIWANKVSDEEYDLELSSDSIYDPLNEFFKVDDCLLFELHVTSIIDAKILRPVMESTTEGKSGSMLCMNLLKEDTAEMALVKNLGSVERTRFTDLKVKIGDTVVGVSKGLFAARSKFFLDYLKEHPDVEEIELDTSVAAFMLVMDYVYRGNFEVGSMSTMLTLIELAKKLQMERLYGMCYNYIMYSIDASNVHLIKEMGSSIVED